MIIVEMSTWLITHSSLSHSTDANAVALAGTSMMLYTFPPYYKYARAFLTGKRDHCHEGVRDGDLSQEHVDP
jgi:hypothetical protein